MPINSCTEAFKGSADLLVAQSLACLCIVYVQKIMMGTLKAELGGKWLGACALGISEGGVGDGGGEGGAKLD